MKRLLLLFFLLSLLAQPVQAAFIVPDRTQETTTTVGIGTVNLLGAVTGYRTFVAGVGSGNTTYYAIALGAEWEVGLGTVIGGSPAMLSRDTVLSSSNGGAKVNFSAGSKNVFVTMPASRYPVANSANACSSVNADASHFLRGDCTWQTIAGGGDALTASPLSQFAATTSLQLLGVLSNETGSGLAVFNNSPTLIGPTLGAATGTSLTLSTPLGGASGGLGVGTLAIHGVLIGQGTGPVSVIVPGAAGQVLTSNGASSDPTFQASAGGSSSFGTLTSATNTTAAMVVGTGASLATSGSGTIAATSVTGLSGLTTGTIPKAASASTLTNSLITESGTTISLGTCAPQCGGISQIGTLKIDGSTSGTISILGQAAAGTYNLNLPTTAGTAGQLLTSQGGGATAMTWTTAGGSGTVNSGVDQHLAKYSGTGTVVDDSSSLVIDDATPTLTIGTGPFAQQFEVAVLTANRTFHTPDANSVSVVADTGAANNFLTAISAEGAITKAQPTVANLASSTSAALVTVLSDETGTGLAVFGTSPTLITPTVSGKVNGSGTAPAISGSCGTSPSILGTDMAGKLTTGTGSPTSCVLTFAVAYTNAPACVANNETTALLVTATSTTTTLTLAAAFTASDVLSYICIGRL